jgi:hypothetical protein
MYPVLYCHDRNLLKMLDAIVNDSNIPPYESAVNAFAIVLAYCEACLRLYITKTLECGFSTEIHTIQPVFWLVGCVVSIVSSFLFDFGHKWW